METEDSFSKLKVGETESVPEAPLNFETVLEAPLSKQAEVAGKKAEEGERSRQARDAAIHEARQKINLSESEVVGPVAVNPSEGDREKAEKDAIALLRAKIMTAQTIEDAQKMAEEFNLRYAFDEGGGTVSIKGRGTVEIGGTNANYVLISDMKGALQFGIRPEHKNPESEQSSLGTSFLSRAKKFFGFK